MDFSLISRNFERNPLPPVVSVVVPAFNEERRLVRCLASILASSIPRAQIEVIVVNNNSTDNTAAVARQYADIVLDHAISGAYQSRNAGAARASSDLLAFVDADCIVGPDLLADALSAAARGCAGGTCRKVPDDSSLSHRYIWWCYDFVDRVWMAAVGRPYNFFAAFCFVQRRFFTAIGGFDSSLGVNADHEFGRRIAECGPVAYLRSSAIIFSVRRLAQVGYCTYWMRTKLKRHVDYPHFR
jgi:glycosyltransferase involved in cell wall biosynthesis